MTQLEHNMTVLRRLFEPWNTAPHGPVIWEPEASDANAQFKRGIISKAAKVITAGESALAGASFTMPQFGESEFNAISATLATDHEERAFHELAVACESVVKALGRVSGA